MKLFLINTKMKSLITASNINITIEKLIREFYNVAMKIGNLPANRIFVVLLPIGTALSYSNRRLQFISENARFSF